MSNHKDVNKSQRRHPVTWTPTRRTTLTGALALAFAGAGAPLASAHDRHPHHPRPNPWQGLVRATVARMTLHEKVGSPLIV